MVTKSNEAFVGKVKITYRLKDGGFDYLPPENMSGAQYKQWQNRNKDAIEVACGNLIAANKPTVVLLTT